MKKIKEYYSTVFGSEFGYTICLWILSSAPAVWFNISYGLYSTAALQAIQGFFVANIVTAFCCLFNGKWRSIAELIFFVLGAINVCVDEFIHQAEHSFFTGDFVAIILGSNTTESKEFLNTHVTSEIVIFSVIAIIISTICFLLKKHIHKLTKRLGLLLFSCFVICGIFSFRDKDLLRSVFLMKTVLFAKYEKPRDLSLYRQFPIISVEKEQPQNVVVIFGESLSSSLISLYGYDKKTTPQIDSLYHSGVARFFENVSSSATTTIPSFKRMLSTSTASNSDKAWYSYLTVFDVLRQGGYYTSWISNQGESGYYDNIVSCYASLSDTLIWCGNDSKGISNNAYDEVVIPDISSLLECNQEKNSIWFIHLMGNHENFNQRYPSDFSVLSEKDYMDYEEKQRKTLAHYDNSIIYNDFIINKIISLFNDKEAVIVYLSDHGLDIYDSAPDYCGHARKADNVSVEAALRVPFFVFGTEVYINNYPEEWSRICEKSKNSSPYNLENLMFTIMDLCNISLADSTQMGPSIFDQN